MKSSKPYLVPLLLSLLAAAPTPKPPPPETLTVADLANHPERLPETVTLKDTIKFGGGVTLKKGQKMHVVSFDGKTLKVDNGKRVDYPLEPTDCDLLDAANAAWQKLTPAQRAVDADALASDASLWPTSVKLLPAEKVGNRNFPANTEFALAGYTPKGAHIYAPSNEGHLINVALSDTDLLARARELAKTDPAQRPSRITTALKGKLVNADGTPSALDVDTAKVFVLYYGADWCPWCHKLSPTLVKTMNEIGPKNPRLAFVMIDDDNDPNAMLNYMTTEKMPWPALPKADAIKAGFLFGMKSNTPHLLILDHYGNEIYSQPGGGPDQITADAKALMKLDADGTAK